MNDDFETKLRRLLNESVDARLGARRAAPERPRRDADRRVRPWLFPLVAAAAVAAVALGTFGATQLLADRGHSVPPASGHPTPTSSVAPHLHSVRLGQARIALPDGWVAHQEGTHLSAGQRPPGTWWCLTPPGAIVTQTTEDCVLNFAELPSDLFTHGVGGNGKPQLDVDTQGGFYGNPPQRCVPDTQVSDGQQAATRTLGGRAADWRRWESHCSKTHRRIDIEQYVVATGPAYILYSTHADGAVHAAMTEIATASTLPAQTSALRFMDRGRVRQATPTASGGTIVITRVVRDDPSATKADSTTYTYRVSASAWRAAQRQHLLGTGKRIALWTDGRQVQAIEPD